MTKQELVERDAGRAGVDCPADGQARLRRRGRGHARRRGQQVTEDDGAADTTIKVGWDDWQADGRRASSTA